MSWAQLDSRVHELFVCHVLHVQGFRCSNVMLNAFFQVVEENALTS